MSYRHVDLRSLKSGVAESVLDCPKGEVYARNKA